jgi:Protein of unknown function (DUF433)
VERQSVIVSDPEILGGTPCFRRTRVPVDSLTDYLEAGDTLEKNGEMLSLAEPGFDVLLTRDKNIPYQQDLKLGRIASLTVRAPSNRI